MLRPVDHLPGYFKLTTMKIIQNSLPTGYTHAHEVIIEQVNYDSRKEVRFFVYPSDYPTQRDVKTVAIFKIRSKEYLIIEEQERQDEINHRAYMNGETIDLSEVDYRWQIEAELH